MTMKRLMFAFVAVALAAASAATKYDITLFQPTIVNGTELRPGDYKVEVEGDKAVFKQGKTLLLKTPVRVQDSGEKNRTNAVRYAQGANAKLQEIRLGGTRTKLVFEGGGSADAAAGSR
jgi:hypothetical protein